MFDAAILLASFAVYFFKAAWFQGETVLSSLAAGWRIASSFRQATQHD